MTGWNLGILLVLVAGHAELWIALVNRLHALPIDPNKLQRVRHLHDLMIPGFAVVVLWGLGLSGPGLLLGGSWNQVSVLWYPVLLASALGAVGGLYGVLRFHRTRHSPQLVNERRQVHPVKTSQGKLPLVPGRFEKLARLPFNEQFHVELSHKTFLHPCLPTRFSGLKILHISDWHFEGTITREYFEQVADIVSREVVDIVTFTGDLLDNDRCVEWLPTTLGKLSAPLGCWFILGNHDWYLNSEAARRQLTSLGWKDATVGVQSIHWRDGRVVIAGDETPWMGSAPQYPVRDPGTGTEAQELRLLLSHTPDNLQRARAHGVDVMLSGHNHGGQVQLPLIGPVFSPSRYGCRYAGGSFWESPTLLHVSRGLSGRHPLRWRCRPEVTVIELMAERSSE